MQQTAAAGRRVHRQELLASGSVTWERPPTKLVGGRCWMRT